MRNEAARGLPLTRLAATLAGWALLLVASSTGWAADTYRVQGVPADATAESGVAARATAIERAEREGLVRLLRRLTSPTDHGRLPSVAGVPIDRYVNSFEIAEEKIGPTRYVATLNVSYVAAEVQDLLRGSGLPYVTRRSDPILVVPVEETATGPVAWDEASPWRAAWFQALDQATVTTLALPLADLADMAAAPAPAVAAGDKAALEALARRYGAESVVVTAARLERAADTGRLERVRVTAHDAAAWKPPLVDEVVEAAPATDKEDEAQLLARAAGLVVAAIEDDWKRRTLSRDLGAATVVAAVPLADLAGWVQIRSDLSSLPEVQSLTVESVSRTGARVAIGYDGDLAQLSSALGRVGLALAEENDGWHLRPAVGPAALPAPSPVLPPTR
jgi:hypothetical protein